MKVLAKLLVCIQVITLIPRFVLSMTIAFGAAAIGWGPVDYWASYHIENYHSWTTSVIVLLGWGVILMIAILVSGFIMFPELIYIYKSNQTELS